MLMEQTDSEDTVRVLEEYRKNGSQELRNRLIMHYLPIVRSAAVQLRSMAGSLLEQEELIDQGVLALIECLERYDPDRGARFETFAFMRVRGAMIDYIRSQDWVPLDLPVEKVENHIKYMNHANLLSFESVLQDMTAIVAKGELESGDIEGKPEENLFYKELMGTLTSAIDGLGEKERLVITLYYYEELKYSEIAQVMGIGQSRVCQIHTRAIQKLKASLEDYMRG